IAHQLPRLAIPSGWMALYEGVDGPKTGDAPTRLVLAYDAEPVLDKVAAAAARPAVGTIKPAVDLLPAMFEALGRRASIVVEPLFFHERPLGCLILEMGPREGMVYESLAEQVSSALEGARLVT